jgi:hypothetical protein
MVAVDTRRLLEDLRNLLYEPFRSAFLRRESCGKHPDRKHLDMPSATIEAVASSLLFDRMRSRIGAVVSRNVLETARPAPSTYSVYAPELLKALILDIGREAWARRYDGPLEAELKVRETEVSLHRMRHPGSTAAARLD